MEQPQDLKNIQACTDVQESSSYDGSMECTSSGREEECQKDVKGTICSNLASSNSNAEDCVSNMRSPTLSEDLKELSNMFESMSSQLTSSIHEGVEPKTSSPLLKIADVMNECLNFLNNASLEELTNLKSIGEKRANSILELREESPAPFKKIDDLKGLGLSLNQIKEMISQLISEITNNYIDDQYCNDGSVDCWGS